MSKPRLVLIGNGMAGVRTVEELLKIKPDHYDITIFGAEPHPNYNRILLSPVLAGEMTIQEIVLNELAWYKENNIKLHTSKQIKTIDRVKRKVIADDGTEESYDRLLIATGSTPFMLPIPGNDLPGVIGYRDIKDTDEMIDAAARHKHAVVIGGGLLGLEAANGLKLRGMDVTVVHLGPWLLERQLDEVAGKMLQKSLEDKGLKFLLQTQTEALIQGESGRVAAIRFKDGLQSMKCRRYLLAAADSLVREQRALLQGRQVALFETWSSPIRAPALTNPILKRFVSKGAECSRGARVVEQHALAQHLPLVG